MILAHLIPIVLFALAYKPWKSIFSFAIFVIISLVWLLRKAIGKKVMVAISNRVAADPQGKLAQKFFTTESVKTTVSGADQPERKMTDDNKTSIQNRVNIIILMLGLLPFILAILFAGISAIWGSFTKSCSLVFQDFSNGFGWACAATGFILVTVCCGFIITHIILQAMVSAMICQYWPGLAKSNTIFTVLFGKKTVKLVALVTYVLHRLLAAWYFVERTFLAAIVEIAIVIPITIVIWRLTCRLAPKIANWQVWTKIASVFRRTTP